LRGQRFVLATRKHNWGEDRVMYFDERGAARSMPARWTSVRTVDAFAEVAAGRSWFRLDDLLDLGARVAVLAPLTGDDNVK